MTDPSLLGLEILAGSLASNIEAFAATGARAKRYRLYALCRRQEAERRQIYAILAEWRGDLPPLPITTRFALRLRRLFAILRVRWGEERAAMIELRREDAELMAAIRALADQNSLPFTVFEAIKRLGRLILQTRAELAEMARAAPRRRPRNAPPAAMMTCAG